MAEWGITEISDTNKDLKEAGVMKSISRQFNLPVRPVKKADGSWRMSVGDYKFNKVMPPIAAALPYVVTLLEQINTVPATWYAASDPTNAYFSIQIGKKHQKQFAFTWQGQQYNFTVLPHGYTNFPALCHNIVHRDIEHLHLPISIKLVQYIDDIMLIGSGEQKE